MENSRNVYVPFLTQPGADDAVSGQCAALTREFMLSQIPIPGTDEMLSDIVHIAETVTELWEINSKALGEVDKVFQRFPDILDTEELQSARNRTQDLERLLDTGKPAGEWRLHRINLVSNDRIALNWLAAQMVWSNFSLLTDYTTQLAIAAYRELESKFPGVFTDIVEDLEAMANE
ncbi:MAG: hypothetical protein QW683_08730 [Candidatus Caldarchaeum sp.]